MGAGKSFVYSFFFIMCVYGENKQLLRRDLMFQPNGGGYGLGYYPNQNPYSSYPTFGSVNSGFNLPNSYGGFIPNPVSSYPVNQHYGLQQPYPYSYNPYGTRQPDPYANLPVEIIDLDEHGRITDHLIKYPDGVITPYNPLQTNPQQTQTVQETSQPNQVTVHKVSPDPITNIVQNKPITTTITRMFTPNNPPKIDVQTSGPQSKDDKKDEEEDETKEDENVIEEKEEEDEDDKPSSITSWFS